MLSQDKLLKISADEWDTLSDAELKAILDPLIKVCRPSPELRLFNTGNAEAPKRHVKKTILTTDEMMLMMKKAGISLPKS